MKTWKEIAESLVTSNNNIVRFKMSDESESTYLFGNRVLNVREAEIMVEALREMIRFAIQESHRDQL
jgi:hypothetical protein